MTTGLDPATLTDRQRVVLAEIARRRRMRSYPASPMQRGVWFLEQLRPENPGYLITAAARLTGDLDIASLERAIASVVARHETLRTALSSVDGNLVQRVLPAVEVPVPVYAAQDRPIATRVHDAVGAPYRIEEAPLARFALLAENTPPGAPPVHVLAIGMHHLVSDGWSVNILLSEIAEGYAGRAPTDPLTIQYGDYARWSTKRLDGTYLDRDLDHWRTVLHGAPSQVSLPADRVRPAVRDFAGASVDLEVAGDTLAHLCSVGRTVGATAYMTLLAVFSAALHRHGDHDDVIVGVPTSGRDRSEVEPLIGFFVNTLPLRVHVAPESTFRSLVDDVRAAAAELFEHQRVPFDAVVNAIGTPRDLSSTPVFQTCFTYQADPAERITLDGLTIEHIHLPARGSRYDLEVQLFEERDRATGWIEYDPALFDPETVTAFAQHFTALAASVAAAPDTPIGELTMMSAVERDGEISAGIGPRREWSAGLVHEEIERRANLHPDRDAVRFDDVALTYAELNSAANRLANHLRDSGVATGDRVAVSLYRSIDLVIALLGVLKAGAAYLPLDPEHPADRVRYTLADADPAAVLVNSRTSQLYTDTDTVIIDLDRARGAINSTTDTAPEVRPDPDAIAYVIYTSGSTGRPKGVPNTHGGIRNRLLWMQDTYSLDESDIVLQKTPFGFDVSVWEFFWPLLAGARLEVALPGGHRDPGYVADLVRRAGVTTLHFVPSMLAAMVAAEGLVDQPALRRIICSGEALPRTVCDAVFAQAPSVELHNLYGPTEAAVDVTAWQVRPDERGPVVIGVPIANTDIHVLDARGHIVPRGVPGELHIGGVQIAAGYLGRPELTAERFIHDHVRTTGGRLYRTGDLVRRRRDGAIEYLGRLDHQVKIRGLRIELGEIEAVLVEHPAVDSAVVTTLGEGPETRLVAHIVSAVEVDAPDDVLTHLRGRLPDYMVPSAIIPLYSFPVTANGKLDRAALPRPDWGARAESDFVAPAGEAQSELAAIWSELLAVPRVGIHSNFFDLGGTSMLVTRMRTMLIDRLGVELPVVELFAYPTVADLAARIETPGGATESVGASAADRADRRRDRLRGRRDRTNPSTPIASKGAE